MIKTSAYIRQFTTRQRQQLIEISQAEGIKNASDVLLFVLDKYQDNRNEISRLKRFLDRKTTQITELKEKLENHGIE